MESGTSFATPGVIVVMGVAASGKTTAGRALAQALTWPFYDADDYHSATNKAKMHSGLPLTDEDRTPWLATLQSLIGDVIRRDQHAVLACSALKAWYRAALIPPNAPPGAVRFVYLDVPREALAERLAERSHFFPVELLDSQLDTLEKPRDAVWVDGTQPVLAIVNSVRVSLGV